MNDFFNKFLLAGIPLVVLIPFIVNGLKTIFPVLEGYGAFVAVGVSAVCVGAVAAIDWRPELDKPVQYGLAVVLFAITYGLSASGAYTQARALRNNTEGGPPPTTPPEPPSSNISAGV